MAIIIQQQSLFNYNEIEKLGDLERLSLALNGIDDEQLMLRLEKRRGRGRNDYPIRAMWNSLIAMMVFGHKTIASLIRELKRNVQLRRMLGFDDNRGKRHLVPPERVYTGFLKLLEIEAGTLDEIFTGMAEKLRLLYPGFGMNLAGDGKYIDSYAKNRIKKENKNAGNRAEHDAEYSKKEYLYTGTDGKEHIKKETHYGFKAHVICDVATELPVAFSVTAANGDERAEMTKLINALPEPMQKNAQTIALDRGYDSIGMINTIKGAGIKPVVDIRNSWKNGETTKQYKNTDIVYDYSGNVFMIEGDGSIQTKMKYEGYDEGKKCLRYSHNGKIYKLYINYDPRIFLPIARDSKKFARLYKGRTSIERLNGRLDRDFMFEDHCIRGLGKIKH